MSYLPFVDGLRAIAILAVVAFHAVPQFVPGGFVGVDVFFVISGFLITRFIAEEMHEGTFSLFQFYVRRARRLLPAAIVCFVAVAVLSAFILLPDAYWYFGRSLMSAVLMYANIFFYNTGGYFSAPALEKPLMHTWSLAVEDQFYLTWPVLLLLLFPRVSKRTIITVAVIAAGASLVYAEREILRDSEFAFFLLPTRAWELLLGVLVALLNLKGRLNSTVAEGFAGLGLVAIVGSLWVLDPEAHFPGLGALPACLGTAAIVVAGLNQTTLVSRGLSLRPVVGVGLISYSLYLWHWPLIALSSYRLERPLEPIEALPVVVAAVVLSILSWRYVEMPFRKRHQHDLARGPSTSDKIFVVQALAAVVLVIGIAGALKIGKGFPQRYQAEVRTLLSDMVNGNPVRRACDNYDKIFRNDEVCNLGRPRSDGQSYDVALFGDSMADHWTPLVAKYAQEQNLSFRQVTNGGCVLLFRVQIPARPEAKARECAAYQSEAEKFIAANPGLKLAVISSYWEKWRELLDEDAPARFEEALRGTVEAFTRKGVRVLLVGQIPVYAALPLRCIVGKLEEGGDAKTCGLTRAAAQDQLNRSDAALKEVVAGNSLVSVWLPFDAMCQEVYCSPLLNGRFLYKNGGHVNAAGAEILRQFVAFPKLP